MNLPRLNIIIPTLLRPDTLYWTLKTVLEQDYENFGVLVSDNFSNDTTPEVVASFNDKRVKYIKTDCKLSMSHHWEFALSHVQDGYVTVLGDDDGILPGGLSKVAAIIKKHKLPAISWHFGNFNWKGLPPFFVIPMGNTYRVIDAKKEVEKIFQQSVYNTIQFPSLYGGFIKKELIDDLKQKYNGQFFHSRIPDFFSGGIVAATVEKYIRIEYPITINATSKHSTGFATVSNDKSQSAFNDLRKNDGSNIPFHPTLVFTRSNVIPIAEAMLQVKVLQPSFPQIDLKKMLKEAANEAISANNGAKYNEIISGILEMGKINKIESFTENLVENSPHKPQQHVIISKFSPVSNTLYLDTSGSNINTVYDSCQIAAVFAAKSLQLTKNENPSFFSRVSGFLRFLSGKRSAVYKAFYSK